MTSIDSTPEKVLQKEVDRLKNLCERQVSIIAEDFRANTTLREKLEAAQKEVDRLKTLCEQQVSIIADELFENTGERDGATSRETEINPFL